MGEAELGENVVGASVTGELEGDAVGGSMSRPPIRETSGAHPLPATHAHFRANFFFLHACSLSIFL